MIDIDWTNTNLLKFAVPFALYGLWSLSRRIRQLSPVLDRHVFVRAGIEIVLTLGLGLSIGTLAQILSNMIFASQASAGHSMAFRLVMSMTVALCTAKLIEAGYIRQQQRSGVSGLSQIFRTLLYGISLFLGLLIFLAANDFTRLTVVAGGFAAVLAFALRQSLTDVIAGITLGIQRPFLRRDWIMLEDGTVAEIVDMDWRATHLRGWDRAVFILPNARLAQQLVKILPKLGTPFAATYTILVSGEEEPARVKQVLKEAVKGCDSILSRPAPVIRLADASNVPYSYSLWVHFDGYMASFAGKEDLFVAIHRTLRDAGMRVTAPIQDVRYAPLTQAQDTFSPSDMGV